MNKTMIIAEAGVNHNGSLELAKELVDIAEKAGADYVKFQTFNPEKLASDTAQKASYQIKNTKNATENQLDMLKKLALSHDEQLELYSYCDSKSINFLSSPFDLESLDFLLKLNLDYIKIPSGEITNLPLLEAIGKQNKPTILSTGMCTLNDINGAIHVLIASGLEKSLISCLHCNTEYPTPYEDVHLNAMKTLKNEFGIKVGYSDHTIGIEVPIAAVAMGASIIEKHFTKDRNLPGPDHNASLNPDELNHMVSGIRNIEQALGSIKKKPSQSEIKNIPIARKSIFLNKEVKLGSIITEEDLTTKRPGTGISPMEYNSIIGGVWKANLAKGEILKSQHFDYKR